MDAFDAIVQLCIWAWFLLQAALWALFFLFLAVLWYQSHGLYLPVLDKHGEERPVKFNFPGSRLPSEQGLPFEEYYIQTADGAVLHSWLIPRPDRISAPTIVYFHGNAGSK